MVVKPFQPVVGERKGEFKVLDDAELLRQLARASPVFRRQHRIVGAFDRVQFAVERSEFSGEPRVHEGRGQVADQGRVTAALRGQRLADVVDDVKVIVRHRPGQRIRPVVVEQADHPRRCEFEAAVGAEVEHRVRPEDEPAPEIGRRIGVGRRLLRAVDDLRRVAADSGERLGQQSHLAELQPADDQPGVAVAHRGHVAPRRRPVEALLVRDQRGGERLLPERFERFQREKFRLLPRGKAVDLPLGISTEDGGFTLNGGDELIRIFRQRTGVVPLLLQPAEQGEQRFGNFKAARVERVLPRLLVEEDRDALVEILFPFEVEVVFNQKSELLQPSGNRPLLFDAAFVAAERGQQKGNCAAIQLRHRHTLAEHAAGEAARIGAVLFKRPVDLDRTEQGNVPVPQEGDRLFRPLVGEPPMRQIDHQIGRNLLEEVEPFRGAGDADDIEFPRLQRLDDIGEIPRFTARRAAVAGNHQCDCGSAGLEFPRLAVVVGIRLL